jgi:TolB-like protein/class 3 adenylate cyclase/Flp pilus assembly protein TadD
MNDRNSFAEQSGEAKKEIELEIAHVLFVDIVGYSKLSINEQHARIEELNEAVRQSERFRNAEAANRILKIPTGDGMALVFYKSPEDPTQCAVEISRAIEDNQCLQVRMGIHSGPVSGVVDVNERTNVAGAGINIAQRVMDCGDAGHILLSKHVAEDLENYERWQPFLHDVGTFEGKHGLRLSVTNLYSDQFGNSKLPSKLQAVRKHRAQFRWAAIAIALLLVLAAVAAIFVYVLSREPAASLANVVEKSIAVLPFENLSSEKENVYFTDGVQDEILTHLAKIADLRVISRTSVMQYKSGVARNLREIGQQLGVAHVVEGSVQRADNKVRVNAQLIDARNDRHEWAENFDRPIGDVFAIQSEIAKDIADQLRAKLSPAEKNTIKQRPTADVGAFEQYSKAKTLMLIAGGGGEVDRAYREAVDLLKSAVARDPAFHVAFCQLVLADDTLYAQGYDHTPERLSGAEEALKKAAALRPDSADTHLARAQHLYYALRDYDGALSELTLARRGLPNDPRVSELTGYILRRQGKVKEGLRALQQAASLDPRNTFVLQQIFASYLGLRRYAEAATALDRALQIKPDDVGLGVIRAELDLQWRADPEPMCRFVEHVRREQPASIPDVADNWFRCAITKRDSTEAEQALGALGDNPFFVDGPIQLSRDFGEGLVARVMHDEVRARRAFSNARVAQDQVVQKQKDYAAALSLLGLIDAALGNKQAALEEGRRATERLPVSKDALNGPVVSAYFAMIAAWTGEKDLAIEQLSAVVQPGVYAPVCTHYGTLKTFPFWDPLRGDPRFEQIVAGLAPNESVK